MGDLLQFPAKAQASCAGCPDPAACDKFLASSVPPWDPRYVEEPACLAQKVEALIKVET